MESQSTSSSSMEFLLLEEVRFLEVKDDPLFQWELVDVLDAQEELRENHDGGDSLRNGFGSWDSSISWSISSPDNGPTIEGICYSLLHPDADVEGHDQRDVDHDADANRDRHESLGRRQLDDGYGGGQVDDGNDDDDDDDDDDGYDLDDELVPWNVSNKFGRQRMRKLGKRAFSKMQNSKRSPYLFVRPGCVRGKHGLGLKHSY